MHRNNRIRVTCFLFFSAILITEIIIALFVHDDFIRPYGGDILVSVLICSFLRMIFLYRLPCLPLCVFALSVAVEVGQYFGLVHLLGLGKYAFFRILLGTTFSLADILCYGIGCLLFLVIEKIILKKAS